MVFSRPERVWSVTSRLETGKWLTLYTVHRYMNVEIGRQKIIILFSNNEATQFRFWEYINRNQTFILGSHRPLICSACISKPLNFRLNICATLALEDYTVNLTSLYLADLNPDFTKLSGVYIIYSTNKNTLSSFYRLSRGL